MRVFFRLGEAQLAQPGCGHDLAQQLCHGLGREGDRQIRGQTVAVPRKAESGGEPDGLRPAKPGKGGIQQRAQQFADTVGAEVE